MIDKKIQERLIALDYQPYKAGVYLRTDKNDKVVRKLVIKKSEVDVYGSSSDVFLARMNINEFLSLIA